MQDLKHIVKEQNLCMARKMSCKLLIILPDKRVITSKEVLSALESILEYCTTNQIRQKVDARLDTYTGRRQFMHGSENKL